MKAIHPKPEPHEPGRRFSRSMLDWPATRRPQLKPLIIQPKVGVKRPIAPPVYKPQTRAPMQPPNTSVSNRNLKAAPAASPPYCPSGKLTTNQLQVTAIANRPVISRVFHRRQPLTILQQKSSGAKRTLTGARTSPDLRPGRSSGRSSIQRAFNPRPLQIIDDAGFGGPPQLGVAGPYQPIRQLYGPLPPPASRNSGGSSASGSAIRDVSSAASPSASPSPASAPPARVPRVSVGGPGAGVMLLASSYWGREAFAAARSALQGLQAAGTEFDSVQQIIDHVNTIPAVVAANAVVAQESAVVSTLTGGVQVTVRDIRAGTWQPIRGRSNGDHELLVSVRGDNYALHVHPPAHRGGSVIPGEVMRGGRETMTQTPRAACDEIVRIHGRPAGW